MSFTCTPGQLVAHVISKLAVSDGMTLLGLWELVLEKSTTPALDNLQKNVMWAALVSASDGLIQIKTGPDRASDVPVSATTTYGNLLLLGTELEIFLEATEKCQFRYLTGTENYESLKTSLGDMPFQLLRVIARHGADGILNADLAREANQDARSIRIRLIKLEQANLIVTRSVYVDKKHTTQSWHVKFADNVAAEANEAELDLDASRDVGKLKRAIMDALLKAPNKLRGFSDLRKELNLDNSPQASKFFRSVCIRLHQRGHIEKLNVELPETGQRLYALRLVKPLPKDADEIDVDVDVVNGDLHDEFDQEEEETPISLISQPVFNKIFPPFNQIYQQIYDKGDKGITSGEVVKTLLGVSDYRPYARLFETLPSYLSNGKNLKPSKKYADPYPDYTVSKLYDNEGKLKFYKYFATQFCSESKPAPKLPPKPKYSNESIVALNKKLHTTLGKTSHDALIEKKRRLFQLSDGPSKRPKLAPVKKVKERTPEITETAIIDVPRKSRRSAKVNYNVDDQFLEDDNDLGDAYTPQAEDAKSEDEFTEPSLTQVALAATEAGPTLSSDHLPQFATQSKETKRKRTGAQTYKVEGSARSIQRRKILLDIIRDEGGATYSNVSICRKIDDRMGNSTLTDIKTLARDVMSLTQSGDVEVRKISVDIGGSIVEKKILVLSKPEDQPTQDKLEELRLAYADQYSRKDVKTFDKRLIQLDVRLYVEKPKIKAVSSGERKRRGKNRLRALGDREVESDVKLEPGEGVSHDEDVFSNIKRTRRARKVAATPANDTTQLLGKRGRRNIKLEKSEALALFRAVVIFKAFSREAIDFDRIAAMFSGKDGQTVKQKWGTVRRLFGGGDVVSQGVATFQQMVMLGIKEGSITEKELTEMNLEFFLDYWREYDSNFDIPSFEGTPLFESQERNMREYTFAKEEPQATSLAEKIDDISMRQKEFVLSQALFTEVEQPRIVEKKHDTLRSVLKSIFLADEGKYDRQVIGRILESYGNDLVSEVTKDLMHEREIMFISVDDDSKFVLGDKFKNALAPRGFTKKFFNSAASFKEVLVSLSSANNGLILSQGVMPGEMATLLQLISDYDVEMVRIDRTFRLDSYESRLIDKENLACDIVLKCNASKVKAASPKPVTIPFEGPCKPIWFDLNAELNKPLWIKILTSILNLVVFKPGATDEYLFGKTNVVLNVSNYHLVMNWLVDSECLRRTKNGGYLPTDKWQYILGC